MSVKLIRKMVDLIERNRISSTEGHDHHEQKPGVQCAFSKDVLNAVYSFEELGNPFMEAGPNLMAIHTKDIVDDTVVGTVDNAKKLGEEQFSLFLNERLLNRSKPISDPIKKNSLPTFCTPNKKTISKGKSRSFEGGLFFVCPSVHCLSDQRWKLGGFLQVRESTLAAIPFRTWTA